MYLYRITNIINNKKYIGITKRKPEIRWSNGKGYKKTSYFRAAIEKYGWDNFEHIILYSNLSKEDACQKEIELIKEYDTTNREFGYNNALGGEINIGFKHSEEAKIKMRKAAQERPIDWNKIEKMKQSTMKKVRCVETGEIFESCSDAAKAKNIKGHHIPECCKGQRKTCGGYHWEYIDNSK